MTNLQRILAILLACFCSTTVLAQININIEISGVEKKLQNNVLLFLSVEQQKDHPLMSEARLRRLHKKAPQEITAALQPFGFYRPVIKTKLSQTKSNFWQAQYSIDPGPPLPFAEFNFTISEEMGLDPEFQKLIQNFRLNKGKTFDHIEYEEFKTNLAKLASERGYFNARFVEHRVEIDLTRYQASIFLNYDGGARYHFGDVLLKQDVLDPEFLRRYIPFKKGSPYTLSLLLDFQQALHDSDYFNSVEVSPDQARIENKEIPIEVKLTARKRHRFSIGLGYGTDTGARAQFGWEIPHLNRRGHRFDTDVNVSERGYKLMTHYRVPVFNPRTDQLIYSAGIINEITDVSESTLRTIGVSLKQNRGDWRETLSLNYQKEDYIIANKSSKSKLLLPGINWNRTWGKNFINTFDGMRFDIGMRGASKNLLSDTDFWQLQSGIKFINSLSQSNRIIARGKLGGTWTQEFEKLPYSVRFFAGGAQSVRGYAYQSLGPKDDLGNVVGGKFLMEGSLEYEHSFNNKWGLALFYDAGNAIDNINDKLARGAGLGFRWKSPVGLVRIDLATAISREDHPWRLHVTIGPDL